MHKMPIFTIMQMVLFSSVVGILEEQKSGTPCVKKPRLAAHLQSSLQVSASGRSTPTQQNPQAENIMKEVVLVRYYMLHRRA